MKLALLLSLVSSLQICQQSASSRLASAHPEPLIVAIITGAFPLGQFIATAAITLFPNEPCLTLMVDAALLVLGGIIALLPTIPTLVFGRFIMGAGAGLGFVAATVLLYKRVEYTERPKSFFILGITFALASVIVQGPPLLQISNLTMHNSLCIFSVLCGFVYLILGPKDDYEEDKDMDHKPSSCPSILVVALMVLNVSIGVPIYLAFPNKMFESFGIVDIQTQQVLSTVIPLLQMIIVCVMYLLPTDRRINVIGGYFVSIFLQVMLLLTAFYDLLPPMHHTIAQSTFLILVAVICGVPCNTALCIISEQFRGTFQQTRFVGAGRTVMWILSTISTATFVPILDKAGFEIAYIPYVAVSILGICVVIIVYPKPK